MYKSIVVGTDGSATAAEAVRHAADLAGLTGARLHIVHAFQRVSPAASIGYDAGAASFAVGVPQIAEEDAREILARAAESAQRAGATVETHLQVGDPASALCDAATNQEADLLVVGNKGMSGARRFILGSVPNKVSHHAPCNLLIVNTSS